MHDGPEFDGGLDNIVDAQFDSAVSLNGKMTVSKEYRHLDLNVYMTDVYCQGGGLKRTSDCFQVGLCRNISRPRTTVFCQKGELWNCGASFDATKERFCPFAGLAMNCARMTG